MEDGNSPIWRRARLAASGELSFKILNFVQDLVASTGTNPPTVSAYSQADSDIMNSRSKIELLNHELLNAEMELDAIWRTVSLAEANIRRITDDRNKELSLFNESRRARRRLPTEIVLKIADFLRCEHQYERELDLDGPSYSSIRSMAKAFSIIDGMEEAVLRKIPLVLFVNEVLDPSVAQEIWEDILKEIPLSRREGVGLDPRFSYIEDEEAVAQISTHEEVHLFFITDRFVSKVSPERLAKFAGNLHATVICLSEKDFKDHPGKILNYEFISLMSSVMLVLPEYPYSKLETWKTKYRAALNFPKQTCSLLKRVSIPVPMLDRPGRDMSSIAQQVNVLEIHGRASITVYKLEDLNIPKLLQPFRTSLRSLLFSNPPLHWDLVHPDFEEVASGIVMDLPCLQELRFESINDFDMYGVMVLGNFDCPSLTSLVMRTHYVAPESSRVSNLLERILEEICAKCPQLQRLTYTLTCEGIAMLPPRKRELYNVRSVLPSLEILAKPRENLRGSDRATSSWLLPNLRVLELTLDRDTLEWLVPFASARMYSADVANIHTIYLSDPLEKMDTAPPSVNSLRVLVPEVLLGRMPPLIL
ncbi:hypothetical protein SCHPADRAFT_1001990 [Schizopora paradoxa]|uniref:Uncharacterized protein n=1 Tax=Schizopora paradoxa TaxID=27342 RepID=A0A0H2RBX0_9AGAM|nr:hypothetical protein SCHPADRAFT_1001990 [Schizopora paradoxa]